MTIDPAAAGISAQRRLAQTRAEIIGAILPGAAQEYPHEPPRSRPEPMRTRQRATAAAAAQATADRYAAHEAQRDAVADWMVDETGGDAHAAGGSDGPKKRAPPPMSFDWASLLRRGASIWWRHHPAHAAVEVVDSALSHVASRRPYQMLGVAAGMGALVVLVRPWRLVSITGLALAALKMTDVRSLLGSFYDD